MSRIVVVGGGLCGLTAALIVARAGKSVTLFEQNRFVGGRARTLQREGFRINLGPHALYRRGQASRVLAELGIPVDGAVPSSRGLALYGGGSVRFPGDPFSLLLTSLLSIRGKLEVAEFLSSLRKLQPARWNDVPVRSWLDREIGDGVARQLLEALVRLVTYANAPADQSAAAAIVQLQLALDGGVLYVHEGWQRLVDALHSAGVSAGVNFVTSSRVVRVLHDGEVRGIELGELEDLSDSEVTSAGPGQASREARGTSIGADAVVLAIDLLSADGLLQRRGQPAARRWSDARPVQVACLDVALSSLPLPNHLFALGIDEPTYFSVHSAWAHLAPKGGALIHLAKYLNDEAAARYAEQELERLLERLQPGWQDRLVNRRFLPRLTVSSALISASSGGFAGRPDVTVPDVRNLYIAGDWVGPEGLLSDASFASAKRAALRILES